MKLITLDEAVKLINEKHQNNPQISGRDVYSKRTLYNKIFQKQLKRYGPKHMAQLDEAEVLEKLCRQA